MDLFKQHSNLDKYTSLKGWNNHKNKKKYITQLTRRSRKNLKIELRRMKQNENILEK